MDALANELDPRMCRQMLDAFLLYRELPERLMEWLLGEIGSSRFRGHLALVGLDGGIPLKTSEGFEALLRLRILFCDVSCAGDELLSDLARVSRVRQVLIDYVRGASDSGTLREAVRRVRIECRNEAILVMFSRLMYTVSMANASTEDPQRVERPEMVDVCLDVIRRVEDYWHGVLGR